MNVTFGETYELKLYRRLPNSPYEYEEIPYATIYCVPASPKEKSTYRVMQGVQSNEEHIFLRVNNLPAEIKPQDKVVFLGETKAIGSIGYYFDKSYIVNARVMKPEYIYTKCPKGLTLL